MEATGVYWLPLYGILEAAGLDVRMDANSSLKYQFAKDKQACAVFVP